MEKRTGLTAITLISIFNMSNKFIFIFIFLLFSINLYSQVSIQGRFLNSSALPLENVIVQLLKKGNSSYLVKEISDKHGNFKITEINSGEYILSYLSEDGYIQSNDLWIGNSNIDLGNIIIEDMKEHELSEIVVTGKRPLFESKIDGITVNVQENISFAGGTALEILSRSPGVNISKERNIISLNGKNDVLVMFDGKTSRMPIDALIQMLDGMPAQNIQKIELIVAPGAKYEAGSIGGIINIVGFKNKDYGTNGNASLMAGWGGKEKIGATLNINHKADAYNLYSDAAYYRNHNDQTYQLDRIINNEDGVYKNKTFTDRDPLSDYFTAKVGLDYDFNVTTKAGAYLSGMMDLFHLNANTDVTNTNNLNIDHYIKIINKEKNNWSNFTSNLYFNKQLTFKQELNLDFTYLYYYNKNTVTNDNDYFDDHNSLILKENIKGEKDAPVNAWVGMFDYLNKITEKSKLEFGLKYSTARYNNDIKVHRQAILDENLTQVFKLTESIYAAYGNYSINLTDKTELQAGLRYEYFYLKSNSLNGEIKRKSGDLFPSVYLSHRPNDKNTIQLSYNRRVARPAYNDFAPYYTFIDPSTSFAGNENLDQSIIDGIKLDYKYSRYLLSFQYAHEDNGIARFQPQADLENNTLQFSSINMEYRYIYTLLLSVPVRLASWWDMQNNIMGVRQIFRTKHLLENITFKNNYIQLNSTFSFSLPSDISIELSGFFHTSQLYGFSRNKDFGNMNFALEKKINKVHKLRFAANNLLGTYRDWDIVDDQRLDYYFNSQYNFTPFAVRLTYTYAFGGNRSDSRKKESGSKDIEGRVR